MGGDRLPGRRRTLNSGRLVRSIRPATLAGRAAARWTTTYFAWGERRKRKREQFVLRTAEDVTRTMGDMKGAVMKLGQVLSLMSGVVPEEMAGQLASLHANAPAMAYSLVERVFDEEFGRGPERVFRRFEREPFAAASIGQVHRAWLDDGRAVAVKVQYPGVREAIEHDLANVGFLISMAGLFARGLEPGPIVRDLKEGIIGELDYLREAAAQQRFSDLFAGHPLIRVPAVIPELSASRVLTQEYLAGQPFAAAREQPQEERNRIAEIVFRFSFGNFYRFGLFNGDPHPGNYLILPGGQVGFVDYGCIAEFSPETIDRFKELLFALYAGDLERWRRATEQVGILREGTPFPTEELYEHMHWFWKPVLEEEFTFTPEVAAEMVRRNTQATGKGGDINRCLNIPEGMVFLSRINFGLAGVLASLRARGPWRGIIYEYMAEAPPCTELGRLSAAAMRGPSV